MDWCLINPKYLDFLKKSEKRIPNYEYNEIRQDGTCKKLLKPFFAAVLKHNDFVYVAQVNHVKKRHYSMPESKDFIKIFDPVVQNKILCVVNLNYMFPVSESEIEYLAMKNIEQVRDFDSLNEKSNYINLLNIEMKQMQNKNIPQKASNLYSYLQNNNDSKLKGRCFNWDDLEKQCSKWTQNRILESIDKDEIIENKEFYYENNKYTILTQGSDKNYFAAINSNNYNDSIPKDVCLFKADENEIKNVCSLDEQVDICGSNMIPIPKNEIQLYAIASEPNPYFKKRFQLLFKFINQNENFIKKRAKRVFYVDNSYKALNLKK